MYGPAPLLLGIYPDKMKSVCGRDICTDMLIVAVWIAKIAKHRTNLNVYEKQMELQNVVYIHR